MRLVLLSLLSTSCLATYGPSASQSVFFSNDGSYKFAYDTGPVGGYHVRQESRDPTGVVAGSYSYEDPSGHHRKVQYRADDAGFQADSSVAYGVGGHPFFVFHHGHVPQYKGSSSDQSDEQGQPQQEEQQQKEEEQQQKQEWTHEQQQQETQQQSDRYQQLQDWVQQQQQRQLQQHQQWVQQQQDWVQQQQNWAQQHQDWVQQQQQDSAQQQQDWGQQQQDSAQQQQDSALQQQDSAQQQEDWSQQSEELETDAANANVTDRDSQQNTEDSQVVQGNADPTLFFKFPPFFQGRRLKDPPNEAGQKPDQPHAVGVVYHPPSKKSQTTLVRSSPHYPSPLYWAGYPGYYSPWYHYWYPNSRVEANGKTNQPAYAYSYQYPHVAYGYSFTT